MNLFDSVEANYEQTNLTDEQEVNLITRAQAGDRTATMQLLCNYLPKLKKIVAATFARVSANGSSQRGSVSLDDLRSAAVEGFFDALKAFEPGRSRRLSHKLDFHVRMQVREARDAYLLIEVPHAVRTRFTQALRMGGGNLDAGRAYSPSVKLLPETYDAVARAYSIGRATGLIEDQSGSRPAAPASDGISPLREARSAAQGTSSTFVREEALIDAAHALSALDPRERLIVETLFGIGCEPHSVREAAAALGIPRTTIQRASEKALARMRDTLGA